MLVITCLLFVSVYKVKFLDNLLIFSISDIFHVVNIA